MIRLAALLLTVLTGFSGLVYEVAWQKYLATLLGSHSEATAAVLAIFLGGLSAGYAMFGGLTRAAWWRARGETLGPCACSSSTVSSRSGSACSRCCSRSCSASRSASRCWVPGRPSRARIRVRRGTLRAADRPAHHPDGRARFRCSRWRWRGTSRTRRASTPGSTASTPRRVRRCAGRSVLRWFRRYGLDGTLYAMAGLNLLARWRRSPLLDRRGAALAPDFASRSTTPDAAALRGLRRRRAARRLRDDGAPDDAQSRRRRWRSARRRSPSR